MGEATGRGYAFGRGTHPAIRKKAVGVNPSTSLFFPTHHLPGPSISRPQAKLKREGKELIATFHKIQPSRVQGRVEKNR